MFPGNLSRFNFTFKWLFGMLFVGSASHCMLSLFVVYRKLKPWASPSHLWPNTKTRVKKPWQQAASTQTVKRRRMERMETYLSSRMWSLLDGTALHARPARERAESHVVKHFRYYRHWINNISLNEEQSPQSPVLCSTLKIHPSIREARAEKNKKWTS